MIIRPKAILEDLDTATTEMKGDDKMVALLRDIVTNLKELFSSLGDGGNDQGFLKLPDDAKEVNPMDGTPVEDEKENEEDSKQDVGGLRSSEDEQAQSDRTTQG